MGSIASGQITEVELMPATLTQPTTTGGGGSTPRGDFLLPATTHTLPAERLTRLRRRRRPALMSTHGIQKIAGFPIDYTVTFNTNARDATGNSIAWPYFLTVELGEIRGGLFVPVQRRNGQQLLSPGATVLRSGQTPGFDPFITPEAPGTSWDVRATLQAAESDTDGQPTSRRQVLDQARHPQAVRGLTGVLPNDSGAIQVPGASARVRVGVFTPLIPTSHPNPFGASWSETRKAIEAPPDFWSYRIQLELTGRIQNDRDITVQYFFRDMNGDTVSNPVVVQIPPPSSSGFAWWTFYNTAAWLSNYKRNRYQCELVVFESRVGRYGRQTVWFDVI